MTDQIPLADERGEFLKRLRNRRQLTQSKLAKAVGLSLSAIQQIESGNRAGRGMHPENARKLLIELAKREPFTPDEIEDFARYFQMERPHVVHLLKQASSRTHVTQVSPESSAAVQGMLGSLVNDLGESEAVELISFMTSAIHIAAAKARNATLDWVNADLDKRASGKKLTPVVTERDAEGMSIKERSLYNEEGQSLEPVPAGEGIVDDPDLLHDLEAELNAYAEANEEGRPPPSVSADAQRLIDILESVPKVKRNKNTG